MYTLETHNSLSTSIVNCYKKREVLSSGKGLPHPTKMSGYVGEQKESEGATWGKIERKPCT